LFSPLRSVRFCRQAHEKDANPWTTLAQARADALAGNRAAAVEALDSIPKMSAKFVSGYDRAVAFAALGRTDDAFAALEDAFKSRAEWLGYLKIDPQVDNLRADPRFSLILKRLGL
jgi:hypothetical protein